MGVLVQSCKHRALCFQFLCSSLLLLPPRPPSSLVPVCWLCASVVPCLPLTPHSGRGAVWNAVRRPRLNAGELALRLSSPLCSPPSSSVCLPPSCFSPFCPSPLSLPFRFPF